MKTLSVILVAYNVPLALDPFFQQPFDEATEVLVVDNSTTPACLQKNAAYAQEHPALRYFPMGHNAGLSVAYNLAGKKAQGDYLLFLDQDTSLPPDFLKQEKALLEGGAEVYCPLVYAEGKPLSPLHYHAYRFAVYGAKAGERTDDLLPISSGTAVRRDFFARLGGFDERYFLDFVDFSFYRQCQRQGAKIVVTKLRLQQDFSGVNLRADKEKTLKRFTLFLNDSAHFYEGDKAGRKAYRRLIKKRALHLFLAYKDKRFLELARAAAKALQ